MNLENLKKELVSEIDVEADTKNLSARELYYNIGEICLIEREIHLGFILKEIVEKVGVNYRDKPMFEREYEYYSKILAYITDETIPEYERKKVYFFSYILTSSFTFNNRRNERKKILSYFI